MQGWEGVALWTEPEDLPPAFKLNKAWAASDCLCLRLLYGLSGRRAGAWYMIIPLG